MQTISLDVTGRSPTGSIHATVLINGQDTGKLYLTGEEHDLLNNVLRVGSRECSDVMYDNTSSEEEVDVDVFEFD
jgi:hypothetical protein